MSCIMKDTFFFFFDSLKIEANQTSQRCMNLDKLAPENTKRKEKSNHGSWLEFLREADELR